MEESSHLTGRWNERPGWSVAGCVRRTELGRSFALGYAVSIGIAMVGPLLNGLSDSAV